MTRSESTLFLLNPRFKYEVDQEQFASPDVLMPPSIQYKPKDPNRQILSLQPFNHKVM